jgi:transcriptional regulator with XRE-family HTH domain
VRPSEKIFGQNLAKLRNQAQLTQEALADKAGISLRYVQFLEAGRKLASIQTARQLKHALKCSWDELFVNF